LQVHPRGDLDRPPRGIFATRGPARPNPIGLSSARVLAIAGTTINVVEPDVPDATPVLDIKPQSPYFDEPFREA
jgi:tRNA (Thr-GGU) A37 N-methylase